MKRVSSLSAARLWGCMLLLCLTLAAPALAYDGAYVFDEAGTLSDEQARALDEQASSIAETYGFGVYLVTVDDFTDYGFSDVYDCAVAFWEESELGLGDGHDGELLFMSMGNRKYAIVYHGYGDIAFTERGRDLLESDMLDCFRNNDWYGGFGQYIEWSDYLLSEAADGEPLGWDESGSYHPDDSDSDDDGSLIGLLIILAIPAVLSGLICGGMLGKMKSVRPAVEARQYAVPKSLKIRHKSDRYTHTTQTRVKIEKHSDSGGGSSHHSGGGFSGRSGSF